jgi:5-methylcytosine-specific restriction enzyme subunit McrC
MVVGKEHKLLPINPDSIDHDNWQDKGLQLSAVEGSEEKVKAHYIIGIQWLKDRENTVRVEPKQNIDFLQDPVVGMRMEKCYAIQTNKPRIPVDKELDERLNLFLLYHFLSLAKNITQSGLKKGFTRVRQNLTGKIRGKVLANPTVKDNHTKGRPDKVYCQYQRFTVDCLENQILATTLETVQKRLDQLPTNGHNQLLQLLHQVKPYFDSVQRIKLNPQVFSRVRNNRFFRNYQQALDVAEQIYRNVTQTTQSGNQTHIYPFWIDMPELFERYCEALLRKQYPHLSAGYGKNDKHSETRAGKWKLRPDFLLNDMILDSKYKFRDSRQDMEKKRADYGQMALYAIHTPTGGDPEDYKELPRLVLIYPKEVDGTDDGLPELSKKGLTKDEGLKHVEEFTNLFQVGVSLPVHEGP